jgi:hypothetical protein
MTTHHLPISIPDILHGKTVEWAHLEFKTGSSVSRKITFANYLKIVNPIQP